MNCDVVFWNVDTQFDFMYDGSYGEYTGKLAVPGASEIIKNLDSITHLAASNNKRVINTRDWHKIDSKEISQDPDFITTFPYHCIQGTIGAEFIPETSPPFAITFDWDDENADISVLSGPLRAHIRNIILGKDKFDIFEGNKYANDIVNLLKPSIAIVYGVAGNVCVDFAVMGLLNRGVTVWVVEDAIQDLTSLPSSTGKWKESGATMVSTQDLGSLAGFRVFSR